MKKNIIDRVLTAVVLITAVALLIAVFIWFRSSMREEINRSTERYLTENVNAMATVFYTKLDDQMVMLESQTRYFKDIDLTDYNLMKKTILSTKGIGAFKTIGVSSSAGSTMNYNGKSSGNIMLTDYFKHAMAGENAMDEATGVSGDNEDVLVLAVPIKKGSETVGIVYGSFTRDVLNDLIDVVQFTNNGANILINKNGHIIAKSTKTDLVSEDATNLLKEIPGLKIPKDKDSGYYVYKDKEQENTVVLTPVGAYDWYFASIVPNSMVQSQSSHIANDVIIVILLVSLIFIFILGYAIIQFRRNYMLRKSNEKYKIATAGSQNIIIDYDFTEKIMTLEGNTGEITTKKKSVYNYEEIKKIFEQIHDEDHYIIHDFHSLYKTDNTSMSAEGRMLGTDGNYHWYKMNAIILRDEENIPLRIVGNITNVDEQVTKEQTLTHKANTDSLTGLLNKVAFETTVQEQIKNLNKNKGIALFIIDLDDFKNVNDTLGHVQGDRAIIETADVLKTIFANENNLGRIGGDEFAAWIEFDIRKKDYMTSLSKIAQSVCDSLKRTYYNNEKYVNLSGSVGIAIYPVDIKSSDYKDLYERADNALYSAKDKGKSRFIHIVET